MEAQLKSRSFAEILGEIFSDSEALVKGEFALIKGEIRSEMDSFQGRIKLAAVRYMAGATFVALGIVLLIAALTQFVLVTFPTVTFWQIGGVLGLLSLMVSSLLLVNKTSGINL